MVSDNFYIIVADNEVHGVSDNLDKLFEQTVSFRYGTIFSISSTDSDKIASFYENKWRFYEASPINPAKYHEGQAVSYYADKVGNIEDIPLVHPGTGDNLYPPFNNAEVEYVINGEWVDEEYIQPLNVQLENNHD